MNNGNSQPDTDLDFDRLFALEGEATPPTQDPTKLNAGEDAGATPPAAPAQAAGEEGEELGGQPAPAGEGGAGEKPTEPAAGATDFAAWIAAQPDDVQKRIKGELDKGADALRQSEDRYKALHGRLAPVQQRLNEVERRLATTQQPAQQPAATQPAPTTPKDSFFDSPTWKEYAEQFPGDAKVLRDGMEAHSRSLEERIAQQDAKLNQLAGRLESTEQVTSRSSLETEVGKLEAKHSDWREVNESPEFWEYFDSWRSQQPKSIRSMYYDEAQLNKLFCDSEFTIGMIDGFKASRQTAAPPTEPVTPPVTPQPESTQPAQPPAQNVRVQMGVAPEVRGGSPVPQAVSMDGWTEAQQFEHLWRQEQ